MAIMIVVILWQMANIYISKVYRFYIKLRCNVVKEWNAENTCTSQCIIA